MIGGILDGLGWFGAAILVVTYYGLTGGAFVNEMEIYHGAVMAGCVLVGCAAAYRRNWSSVGVQAFMTGIAIWGIVQLRHPKPVPSPIPAAVIASKPTQPNSADVPASKPDPPTAAKTKTKAKAKKPAGKPASAFSCAEVRQAVQQYGAELVEREARARGTSERDIARGKKCLRG